MAEHPIPEIDGSPDTEKYPLQEPVVEQSLAKPAEKRAMQTLATPVGALKTNDQQVQWIEMMVAGYDKFPEDIKDALILMQRAFPASGGGTYYITPPQAMMIVRYCKAKGLEIHGDHWWFDPRNYRIGSTVSGLRAEAAHAGVKLGPPVYERKERPWPAHITRIKGYEGNDFGYECKMEIVGRRDPASYTAWLSTSAQTKTVGAVKELRGGPWAENPDHMIQIRAQGNCLKSALGSGVSQPLNDDETSE